MKQLTILWIFYKKLIIPSVLFSLLFSLLSPFKVETFGLSFLLLLPMLHYFIYEVRLKNEYLFYYHFGFSKLFLWGFTLSFSLIVKTIMAFV
ncbi:hypothetical protein [Chryseobacterium sp. Mn2064]|uniref:hypothetical protein n=1 Tax=Chryseobacterium sp. Mn2064 TaxID=3395263 RepID=UPI003BCA917B